MTASAFGRAQRHYASEYRYDEAAAEAAESFMPPTFTADYDEPGHAAFIIC